ncbi:uncharacterized protein PG998_008436 [Apiospora kogelbergensis]|uniref:Uncharacterized protein n=1 Tax=Apiospora kogelbergensis TaxID=1337665 RepID=A0AAW0QC04_9PEZI
MPTGIFVLYATPNQESKHSLLSFWTKTRAAVVSLRTLPYTPPVSRQIARPDPPHLLALYYEPKQRNGLHANVHARHDYAGPHAAVNDDDIVGGDAWEQFDDKSHLHFTNHISQTIYHDSHGATGT